MENVFLVSAKIILCLFEKLTLSCLFQSSGSLHVRTNNYYLILLDQSKRKITKEKKITLVLLSSMQFYETSFLIHTHSKTPRGLTKPPRTIFCNHCGLKGGPLYISIFNILKICTVKIMKKKVKGPFVACKGCFKELGKDGVWHCCNCRTVIHPTVDYCVGCGKGVL